MFRMEKRSRNMLIIISSSSSSISISIIIICGWNSNGRSLICLFVSCLLRISPCSIYIGIAWYMRRLRERERESSFKPGMMIVTRVQHFDTCLTDHEYKKLKTDHEYKKLKTSAPIISQSVLMKFGILLRATDLMNHVLILVYLSVDAQGRDCFLGTFFYLKKKKKLQC